MATRDGHPPRTSRAPLSDASESAVNVASSNISRHSKPQTSAPKTASANLRPKVDGSRRDSSRRSSKAESNKTSSGVPEVIPRHDQPIPKNEVEDKRASQISTSSGASSGKRKTHVGPWQLGKTLGKGSAGRVRLARHRITHEQVAVKILPKHACHITQAGSLASLDKWDRLQPEFVSDNRMPLSIEREVAVLKLIDHPNIMKLYDIWENRSEIYLVLEYVDNGDLFEYINLHGPLPEDETIFYFRQLISALQYCHSFNICHRDLKPENILLGRNGQIKIADFGMAAIQQSPHHQLKTACGSPHYAAPELVGRKKHGYHGDKVDIWSSGVILYACLCARLPFDDPNGDLPRLLAKSKLGKYDEPAWMSRGSKNLIRRMLQVDPNNRITITQIWELEFMIKYDFLDGLNNKMAGDELERIRLYGNCTRVAAEDIDMQTMRQLKSMWHTFTEKELALKLMSDESNDQKLFYWLLCNYREKRLENYVGDVTHSPSDYHHLRPANWKKKFTTLEFPSRYGRTPSRFTVISNVATDENCLDSNTDGGGTIQSYDPYKSSQVIKKNAEASHAKIVVYRNGSVARSSTRTTDIGRVKSNSVRSSSSYSRHSRRGRGPRYAGQHKTVGRSSASLHSTESISYRRAVSRHRRGVNFGHSRARSNAYNSVHGRRSPASIAGGGKTYGRDCTSPRRPIRNTRQSKGCAETRVFTQSMANMASKKDPARFWNEEMRLFSHNIAKDCDEAFNSTILSPNSTADHSNMDRSNLESTFLAITPDAASSVKILDTSRASTIAAAKRGTLHRTWDSRPLPPAPPTTESILQELMRAKEQAKHRAKHGDQAQHHLDTLIAHLNSSVPTESAEDTKRRVVSVPIYSQYSRHLGSGKTPLASICEGQKESISCETAKKRAVSAPTGEAAMGQLTPSRPRDDEIKGLEYLSRQKDTIRVVQSPGDWASTVEAPAPLNVRKKSSGTTSQHQPPVEDVNPRQRYRNDEPERDKHVGPEMPHQRDESGNGRKKSWFKRVSKSKEDSLVITSGSKSGQTYAENHKRAVGKDDHISTTEPLSAAKKRSFSFAFWRNSKAREDIGFFIPDPDCDDLSRPASVQLGNNPTRAETKKSKDDGVAHRNIEPQQNWLARLFRVKPAMRYVCFTISRRRARQEISFLLKDWHGYGIRNVQVDKDRNIVFGQVGPKNYLDMREVSFAAEIMTVIEHGKRNPLSIVRFTQERGAASSFHKVVDTMLTVFAVRNLLVVDKHKIKMMIKTLNY